MSTQFLSTAGEQEFEILAYCFMPDHLHALVVGLTEWSSLEAFVKLAKQHTGYWFRRKTGGRLWQDSCFDRTLREDQNTYAEIKYLLENPMRAGLALSPEDYPHWGSQTYSRTELLEYIASECRV